MLIFKKKKKYFKGNYCDEGNSIKSEFRLVSHTVLKYSQHVKFISFFSHQYFSYQADSTLILYFVKITHSS